VARLTRLLERRARLRPEGRRGVVSRERDAQLPGGGVWAALGVDDASLCCDARGGWVRDRARGGRQWLLGERYG
jgi:hypothetical protein